MLLKKAITIVAAVGLLTLLAAPLVLAQQEMGENQPAPPAQTDQDQSAGGGTEPPLPTLENASSLDANGNLVVDCEAASSNLARLQQVQDALANNPEFQRELSETQGLVRLCADEGFNPNGSPNTGAGMMQYNPAPSSSPLA
jgi:hypothetical protein